MSKELVNPEGLRGDGRRIGELRDIKISLNTVENVDGSCIFTIGNTQVLAVVSGPNDKIRAKNPSQAVLSVEYNVSPFAYSERRNPQSSNPLPGQTTSNACKEYALLLEKTFSNIILLSKWPNAGINMSVTVLCDQGSSLAAAINACTGALIIAGVDMNDVITATTSCIYDGKPLLDATQVETSSLGGSTTLAILNQTGQVAQSDRFAMTQSGSVYQDDAGAAVAATKYKKIATIHHTQRMHLDQLQISFDSCILACDIIHHKIKETVREYIHDEYN